MVAKFLDLYFSFLSWQRRPFVLSNDRRKVIWQPFFFFLSANMHKRRSYKLIFVFFFLCRICMTKVCWDQESLLPWQHDITTSSFYSDQFLREFASFQISFPKLKVYIYRWSCLFVPDVDECTASEQLCDFNANCINTHGSYYCSCFSGFSGDGNTCIGKENERYLKEIHFIC